MPPIREPWPPASTKPVMSCGSIVECMPQPVALVQLAESAMKGDKAGVDAQLEAALTRVNGQLESHARLRGILVVKSPWNIENGVLTPTMKIRRHLLEQKYADIGERWSGVQRIIWES